MVDIALPLTICTRIERNYSSIFYVPEVIGHWNQQVERKINDRIDEAVDRLFDKQYKEQDVTEFEEMIGTFEIKTNERNVLSLTLENYAYAFQHAHGLTLRKSLTFDVMTGKTYTLEQLFKPNSNYVKELSRIVNEQIKQRDIPVLNAGEVKVSPKQPYYLADQMIVLYYPLYAITPYYYGFPLFPIPVYEIQSLIREHTPLARMIG